MLPFSQASDSAGQEVAEVDKVSLPGWDWLTEMVQEISGGRYWIILMMVLATAVIAHYLAHFVLVGAMRKLARSTSIKWDDLLIEHKVFARLAGIFPALVIFAWAGLLFPGADDERALELTQNLAFAYMILVGGRVVGALLNLIQAVLESDETTNSTATRSYFQLGKILLWLVMPTKKGEH